MGMIIYNMLQQMDLVFTQPPLACELYLQMLVKHTLVQPNQPMTKEYTVKTDDFT